MPEILHSIHGSLLGLSNSRELISNGKVITPSPAHLFTGVATVTVTSAQLLALNATPISIVAAPGAGLAILPYLILLTKAAGTAYAGIAAGEDLVLKYTNGSGGQCSSVIETTGFLDQTTAQIRSARAPASTGSTAGDTTPVANAAVVLHLLSGEITTGNTDLLVRCYYQVIPTAIV